MCEARQDFGLALALEKSIYGEIKYKKRAKFVAVNKKVRTFASPEPAKPLNDAQMCGSFYFYTYVKSDSLSENLYKFP